eukprot:scaffold22124_cov22-Prasinocladus_malaysianus.AAC.3
MSLVRRSNGQLERIQSHVRVRVPVIFTSYVALLLRVRGYLEVGTRVAVGRRDVPPTSAVRWSGVRRLNTHRQTLVKQYSHLPLPSSELVAMSRFSPTRGSAHILKTKTTSQMKTTSQ